MRIVFYYLDLFCIALLLIVVNTNMSLISIICLSIAIILNTIGIFLNHDEVDKNT